MKRIQPIILLLAAMTLYFTDESQTIFYRGITRAQTARMLAWTVCDMNKDRAKVSNRLLMLTALYGMPMKSRQFWQRAS